jgi:hypothetical protein
VTRPIALAVADAARRTGVAGLAADADLDAAIDAAMWWPDYVPYLPIHTDERRRVSET